MDARLVISNIERDDNVISNGMQDLVGSRHGLFISTTAALWVMVTHSVQRLGYWMDVRGIGILLPARQKRFSTVSRRAGAHPASYSEF